MCCQGHNDRSDLLCLQPVLGAFKYKPRGCLPPAEKVHIARIQAPFQVYKPLRASVTVPHLPQNILGCTLCVSMPIQQKDYFCRFPDRSAYFSAADLHLNDG